MAFRTKKISQMDPKGSNLASTDLLEISQLVSGSYVTKSITGAEIIASVPPSVTSWGTITGTLSTQTDLQNALNAKEPTITAGTTSQYYRGDKTFQTLDKNAVGLSNVDNTSDLNKPISTATQTALNAKQNTLGFTPVPTTRTLTINGTTQDLSADRTFTISTGITIGTTAITSGTVGRVLFEGTGNVVSESANLFWDNTNGRLGVNTITPGARLEINGESRFSMACTTKNGAGFFMSDATTSYQPYAGIYTDTAANELFVKSYSNINFGWSTTPGAVMSTRIMTLKSATGNVLINTTTDAGFKLDVNGTARVQGNLTLTGASQVKLGSTNRWIGPCELYAGIQIYAPSIGDVLQVTVQQVHISSAGGITQQASAITQIDSTTKGFLPPRMTTTQKNAIATPATGLQIYDSTLNRPCFYDGTTWITL